MKALGILIILALFIGQSIAQNVEGNVYLSSLGAYRSTFDKVNYNTSSEIKMGNVVYPEGIQFSSRSRWCGSSTYDPSCSSRDDDAYFNLNGAYNRLTGFIGIDDKSSLEYKVTLSFMGDDKELQKITMLASDLPKSIDLDVSGVRRLTLDSVLDEHGSDRGYLYLDLVNMTLWKSARSNFQPISKSDTLMPIISAQPPENVVNEVNKPQIPSESISTGSSDVEAWIKKGEAIDIQNEYTYNLSKYDEAIQCYEKAIEIDPRNATAWYKKGHDLNQQGLFSGDGRIVRPKHYQAIQAYDKAIELNPQYASDSNFWYEKGTASFYTDKYDDAVQCFDKAGEIDPLKFASSLGWRAKISYIQGNYSNSVQYFGDYLSLEPRDSSAWYQKGEALDKLGKYDQAIQAYDKSLDIEPNYGYTWYYKGNALKALGRTSEADAAYAKAKEMGYSG